CTTTSAIPGSLRRRASSSSLASWWASAVVAVASTRIVMNTTLPRSVGNTRTLAAGLPVSSSASASITCVAAVRPPADRELHPLGPLVGLGQRTVGGELQVKRNAYPVAVLEDRDVVRLADQRLAQRDRQDPVSEVQAAIAGVAVPDHL